MPFGRTLLLLPALGQALTLGARRTATTRKLRSGVARALATVAGDTDLRQPDHARWQDFVDSASSSPATTLLVVQKEGYDEWLAGRPTAQQSYLTASGFEAFKEDGVVLLPGSSDGGRPDTCVFLTANASRVHAFSSLPARLPAALSPYEIEMADGTPPPAGALLSWGLGCYSFDEFKQKPKAEGEKPKFATLRCGLDDELGAALSATYLVRDLINLPAQDMGPAELQAAAARLAASHGASCDAVVGDALLTDNYPQIHAVGRAASAAKQPRLIDLRWGEAGAPRVTLVGKGVTFDTGGLNMKPGAAMLTMKKDMGGAAHVLGLAHMVMACKLPVRLRVLVAAAENSISGDAFRPGDVLTARNGKTTEIGNTDAEGRLVLADALVEACAEAPALLVDVATLTGAGRVALGTDVPALFANGPGEAAAAELQRLSADAQDQVWQLPLWSGYRKELDGKIADLKNIGSGPYGGAITAALYLNEFVAPPPKADAAGGDGGDDGAEAPPWLHLDLMAYNTAARPGRPEGGEAMGVRALFSLLKARFG